jgi:uncharacterized repeat protein (TIGR01451 family)
VPTTPPATATSAPPAATATSAPLPTEAVPPTSTATSAPPPTEEPPADEPPPDRTPKDDPTPQPTSEQPPTATPQMILITPEPTAAGTPNVVVTKQASRHEVRIGDELTYTITAKNTGTAPAEAVVVTDAMPAQLEILRVTSSQGSASTSGQSITVQVGTLAPGQQVVITISVRVRAAVAPGDISNLAMGFTSTPGDPPGDNTTTVTVTILPPAPTVAPPASAQPPRAATTVMPQRVPKTADPDETARFLLTMLPLILLAFGMGIFGVMLRRNAFRQQVLVAFTAPTVPVRPARVTARMHGAPAADAAVEPAAAAPVFVGSVRIDPDMADALYQRWQAGTAMHQLVDELVHGNPGVSKTVLTLALQNLLTAYIRS